ncbi:MAG TPA: Cof-type HAD-IIB family hydrolase [Ktedonobacteraceae bacterium]|nr:Cof-type HAD-IIB family hydrolase [Ktedonobacteraceae bacterium]
MVLENQVKVAAPQQIKLLVIDIDGTLLTPQKRITPRTLAAIRAAQETGVIVTLATARRYYNTAPIATELGIAIPLILYDGALILEHPQGTPLYTHRLRAAIAQQAVEIMVHHHIQPVIHHINGPAEQIWTGPAEFDNAWIEDYLSTFPDHTRRLPYANCCTGQPDPLRVVAFTDEEVARELVPEISALACSWNITPRGSYNWAEVAVMGQGCTKASGVIMLARQFGIPLEQVMAIGDNNNDVEMLQAVGWGVAMGQASDAVKASARAVTASNTEDGVALAIERYILRRAAQVASNSFSRSICL